MARAESKMIMGYLPIEERHYPALFSLVASASSAVKLLDPFAGEGAFLEAAAQTWGMTPYANELDGTRAEACIARFGPTQALRCDAERLVASNNAFGVLWANPPYDHDTQDTGSKRVEFRLLRHAWKWAQEGGIVFWVVYRQHLTESAAAFLAKHSRSVDVWALPGKHLNVYEQIVVVAIKGEQAESGALYQQIMAAKAGPRSLTVQSEPVYRAPMPRPLARFVFAPDMIDAAQGETLIQSQGAWQTAGFQALLEVPQPPAPIQPVVTPRPGHLALVLAAGVADGAVIQTANYGQVALRGKTRHVEQIARVEVEADPADPDRQVKKTTIRLKPATTLTLLADDGTTVEMDGDDALLDFITTNKSALAAYLRDKFDPLYAFDFNGVKPWLDRLRLRGKYPLYTAQKHVVGAVTKGFERRKGLLLVGQMGVGKTVLASSVAISACRGIVQALSHQMRADQIVLVVAPPHLIEKWKRELASLDGSALIERLDRHEDVKAFMQRAETAGAGVAKIALVKRDLTKLGCSWQPAVRWRRVGRALWHRRDPTPEGYGPKDRVRVERVPICPTCGSTVLQEVRGTSQPASANWLKGGHRACPVCQAPLWSEARDRGSQPKPGEKYPSKNPRYRLDEYLKRRYSKRVFLLIWDECHEAQHGDTGNGAAFGRLAGVADKVLAMTGTPFNGRASSLFNLEYHLNPRVRQRFNWGGAARLTRRERGSRKPQVMAEENSRQRGRAEARWVEVMGVREQVVEERPGYDRETGVYTGTTTYERPYEEAPGISPLLVAEVLDHAVFFSLGDLGKALPRFEEIALPVEPDLDVAARYEQTQQQLKDYLIARRWEGDTTFRGAYLQWAMGWINTPFRPYEVIHNRKHPLTGAVEPHQVTTLPSFGEMRVFAKEQALLDLLRDELAADRPCVVYLRQTGTRDIQPRVENLIRQHVPQAHPFILKNTVSAERREKVIETELARGMNVLICNPELVKTGLDLLFAPTLIFYEITFNLGTMMQAAARSYRLNQTHEHCKVYYLFAQGTMEHTAVQLMSRKQRAAKLLTGDVGLTGLDALTEGEGGLEEALLAAIGQDDALLDPAQLFTTSGASDIDAEDATFWNVEADNAVSEPELADPLLVFAEGDLGATVTPISTSRRNHDDLRRLARHVGGYLDSVHLITDEKRRATLQVDLLLALQERIGGDEQVLTGWLTSWLEEHKFVFAGCEADAAAQIIAFARQALGLAPIQLERFEALEAVRDESVHAEMLRRIEGLSQQSVTRQQEPNDVIVSPDFGHSHPQRRSRSKRRDDAELATRQLALF